MFKKSMLMAVVVGASFGAVGSASALFLPKPPGSGAAASATRTPKPALVKSPSLVGVARLKFAPEIEAQLSLFREEVRAMLKKYAPHSLYKQQLMAIAIVFKSTYSMRRALISKVTKYPKQIKLATAELDAIYQGAWLSLDLLAPKPR